MKKLGAKPEENISAVKAVLAAEDVLVYRFKTGDGRACAAVYADGITDKDLLGELVAKPLSLDKAPKTRAEATKPP